MRVPRELLAELARVNRLEIEARAEVDRLLAAAWELGATDRQVAMAMGVDSSVVRMRRHRRGLTGRGRRRGVRPPAVG